MSDDGMMQAWDEWAQENIGSDVGAALPLRAFIAGWSAAAAPVSDAKALRAENERLREAIKSLNWNTECTLCPPCTGRVKAAFDSAFPAARAVSGEDR